MYISKRFGFMVNQILTYWSIYMHIMIFMEHAKLLIDLLFGFNVAFKHLRSYRYGACL